MISRSSSIVGRILAVASTGAALALGVAACGGGATPGAKDAKDAKDAAGASGLVGKPAPEFAAERVTGEGPTTLKDANGKIVILDFWATFCEPCKKSFPKYQEIVDRFAGEVAVVAVSVDEIDNATKEQLEEFVRDTGVKFSVLWDKSHAIAEQYKPPTMPTSFIIDKSGVVRHVHAGYQAGEETAIADEIKALLGEGK